MVVTGREAHSSQASVPKPPFTQKLLAVLVSAKGSLPKVLVLRFLHDYTLSLCAKPYNIHLS